MRINHVRAIACLLPLLVVGCAAAESADEPIGVLRHALSFTEQQQKLVASNKVASDVFGIRTAVSGDGRVALVGAIYATRDGFTLSGAAYIYTRDALGAWTEQELVPSERGAQDSFGVSVALSDDGKTALVSAYSATRSGLAQVGEAYVFGHDGTRYVERQKLVASDRAANDYFGFATALSADGSVALVSALQLGTGAGKAYVFQTDGLGRFAEKQILAGSDQVKGDYFGLWSALSADGKTALIGSFASRDNLSLAGQAYVFAGPIGSFTERQILTASDRKAGDQFAAGVALSSDGQTALIGAQGVTRDGLNSVGQAYVFSGPVGSYTEKQILTASDKGALDSFAYVSLSGDGQTALIGATSATRDGLNNVGAAYVFSATAGTFTEEQKLIPSDRMENDLFGSVAISRNGGTVLVGAPGASPNDVMRAGKVYLFTRKVNGDPCTAAAECTSGFCVDGVCCNAACGGGLRSDCQSCAATESGGTNGLCAPVASTRNVTCRAATDSCDAAEICDGVSTECPADALSAKGMICRAAPDATKVDALCDGQSAVCPLNATAYQYEFSGGGFAGGCTTTSHSQRSAAGGAWAVTALLLLAAARRRSRRLAS